MVLTYVIPMLLVAAIGWLHLEYPMHADQTVAMMGAVAMDQGDVLYADYWVTKQPGIFAFHWLGGTLFGFFEFGVHALELIILLLFSAGLIGFLRSRLEQPWLAGAVPIATVAMYYAVAGTWELTQIDFLVAVPLFICLAFVSREAPTRSAWFASGLAAGIAIVFKLLLAPIPVAIWAMAAALDRRGSERTGSARRSTGWLAATGGVAVVLAITAAWFAANGALDSLARATIAYVVTAVALLERAEFMRLLVAARWFASFFIGPLIFMLTLGMAWKGAVRERWVLLALAWLSSAVGVVLLHSLTWSPHHFLLLAMPVGLLAIRGADGIISATTRSDDSVPAAAVVTTVLVLALLPGIRAAKSKWVVWRDWQISAEQADPFAFRRTVSPAYDRIWRDTAFLRAAEAAAGPICTFGDPRYAALAGRPAALAVNPSWAVAGTEQWDALLEQLQREAPAYVCVEAPYRAIIAERSAAVEAWIRAEYDALDEDDNRTWYRLRAAVDAKAVSR